MNTRRNGFVLVLVLVILMIAAVVMASAARKSSRSALQAAEAQEQLQLGWGSTSCKAVVLPAAPRLLHGVDSNGQPNVVLHRTIKLGAMDFSVVLFDEQAKINVNMLRATRGEFAEPSLMAVQHGLRNSILPLMEPRENPENIISQYPVLYTAYDQVFRFDGPEDILDPSDPQDRGTARITCWGSGLVNFRTASLPVLREATAGILNEAQVTGLTKLREDSPQSTVDDVAKAFKLRPDKAKKLSDVLCDASRCHSLWVVARDRTRSWYSLYVNQTGDAMNDRQHWSFKW